MQADSPQPDTENPVEKTDKSPLSLPLRHAMGVHYLFGKSANQPLKSGWFYRLIPHTKTFLAICALAVGLVGLFTVMNYRTTSHERKSTTIAGVPIVNMDKTSAQQQLHKAAEIQKVQINVDGTTYTFTAPELGIKRDTTSLLDADFTSTPSLIDKLTARQAPTPGLKTYVNKARLVSTIEAKLGNYKLANDATVTVDGENLVVQASKTGMTVDFDDLIQQINSSDLRNDLPLTAKLTKANPKITTAAANDAKTQAEALIAPDYGVTTGGTNKYISRVQKVSWLVFNSDPDTGSIKVSIDTKAAKNTLTKLAQSFSQPGKDETTLSVAGAPPIVVQAGQPGLTVDQVSFDDGLNQFATALDAHQSFMLPFTLTASTPGNNYLGSTAGSKYILVDVPSLRAYVNDGATTVRTMLVSTGIPSMPTPAGHFKILSKYKLLTMKGCNKAVGCWTVPDVPNVEFFTDEGHALHGTYWHNRFGKANLSHGCVNLSLDDAAWLFDWTDVGTDVIIVR